MSAQQRALYTTRIDSLSGTPASIRTTVHRRLLSEGFSVREVAACDCLVTAEPRLIDGQPTEIRIHILRPPNGLVALVVVHALVGPANTPTVGTTNEMTRDLGTLVSRLRGDFEQARIPPLRRRE
jgi:hypothetical protein